MAETRGDTSYAAEKFVHAVYLLATNPGPIKDRLYVAFIEICPVSERDMPADLLADFRWIRAELTKREPRARAVMEGAVHDRIEGSIGATLQTMRKAKAVAIAEKIVALADRLASAREA